MATGEKSNGCAPAADPSLVLGGSWLVLLTSGTPNSRHAEPTTKENQNHNNSNREKTKTPTCRTPSTTGDNNKDKNHNIWESKRHPKTPRKGGQRAPQIYTFLGFFGSSFSSLLGLISGLLGRSLGFWGCWGLLLGLPAAIFGLRRGGCPAEAEKGPKRLKTVQNSSKTCFLSLFGALGKPPNSSHSMIFGGENCYFLAFGCDFA